MLEAILIGAVVLVALIILIVIIVGGVKSAKKNKKEDTLSVNPNETKEVVSSNAEEVKKSEPMKVVIAQGESIVVGSEGRIPCGEYTLESCEGEETFNVRIGRYVKEYKAGDKVVLTEKQKVTPVSTSIILR